MICPDIVRIDLYLYSQLTRQRTINYKYVVFKLYYAFRFMYHFSSRSGVNTKKVNIFEHFQPMKRYFVYEESVSLPFELMLTFQHIFFSERKKNSYL